MGHCDMHNPIAVRDRSACGVDASRRRCTEPRAAMAGELPGEAVAAAQRGCAGVLRDGDGRGGRNACRARLGCRGAGHAPSTAGGATCLNTLRTTSESV